MKIDFIRGDDMETLISLVEQWAQNAERKLEIF